VAANISLTCLLESAADVARYHEVVLDLRVGDDVLQDPIALVWLVLLELLHLGPVEAPEQL